MIAHFVICTLGSPDLVGLAVASIDKFAGDATLDLIQLPDTALGDPAAHGRALDQWINREDREPVPDEDVVVIMDPDVAILSPLWRERMEHAFSYPDVGIWGGGCFEDFGRRIHPSMMAIRGTVFNILQATMRPFHRPEDTDWRDTGGWYCKCATLKGWKLWREDRALGYDWHGFSAWYDRAPAALRHAWDHEEPLHMPLWVHLGGGTWSDPTRLTWLQRCQRRRAIRLRRRFIVEVGKVLAS